MSVPSRPAAVFSARVRAWAGVIVLVAASSASAGSIVGGSDILGPTELAQLEAFLGEGQLTLTRIFAKGPGLDSYDWHAAVDGQGRTFSVMELSTGRVVGGYNSISWNSSNSYQGDPDCFLFSLTNDFRHDYPGIASGPYWTYNTGGYGPTFGGGHDFYISNSLNSGYANIGYTYECRVGTYGSSTCRNDFAGSYGTWTIPALETFTIAPYAGPDAPVLTPVGRISLVLLMLVVVTGVLVRRSSLAG